MKKALKELIANAPIKSKGIFIKLMAISNGVYDGFWGKNGYNNILLLGFDEEDKEWYIICCGAVDKFDIYTTNTGFNLDIPSEYGVPVFCFNKPVYIDYSIPISTITGEIVDCRK